MHFDVDRGQIESTSFASRLISNKEEAYVEIDSAHRLVRLKEGEE